MIKERICIWCGLKVHSTHICVMDPNNTNTTYMTKDENDPVNHPKHYTSDPSGVECITITRHRNFNIGNAIKYLWRAGLKDKDTLVQDLHKSIWYIQNEIERLEGRKIK